MPEQFLHRTNIITVLQEMGGKRMTHRVRPGWLRDGSLEPSIFDGLLEDRFRA
jgi:hypothetical protein